MTPYEAIKTIHEKHEYPKESIEYLQHRADSVGEVNTLNMLEYVSRLEYALAALDSLACKCRGNECETFDCETCPASKAVEPSDVNCPVCFGRGWIVERDKNGDGIQEQCEYCLGRGKILNKPLAVEQSEDAREWALDTARNLWLETCKGGCSPTISSEIWAMRLAALITADRERIRRESKIDNDILFGDIWERLCPAGWNKADWVWECQNVRRDLTDEPLASIMGEAKK